MSVIRGKRDKRLLMAFVWRELTDFRKFRESTPKQQVRLVVKYARVVLREIEGVTSDDIVDNVNINSLGNVGGVLRTLQLPGNVSWDRYAEKKDMKVNLPPGHWKGLPFQKNAYYGVSATLSQNS